MSLYAKINSENIVENVIVCEDLEITTQNGKHVKITENTKMASIGHTYDETNGKFVAPKPYDSWNLDENFNWISPIGDSPAGLHQWNEENQEWVPVIPASE